MTIYIVELGMRFEGGASILSVRKTLEEAEDVVQDFIGKGTVWDFFDSVDTREGLLKGWFHKTDSRFIIIHEATLSTSEDKP